MPTVTAAELYAAIAAGAAPTIIDVRSRREFMRGHVPGAIHIPFRSVGRSLSGLSNSKFDPLVVYCGHGPRAWIAAAALRRHGFVKVSYLKGHMSRWSREGLPEQRG
jgi:rhodanese-related sulfurtransferase